MTCEFSERGTTSGRTRIFVFCRPYLVADFKENVAPLYGDFEFSFLTDGYCPGTADTRQQFYAALSSRIMCSELDTADEEDVRSRCRLLRSISRNQALALMHAMASVICEVLDRVQPKAVLCHLVDEYVTHLIALLAGKRDIRFVSYFASYFPGRVQLTQHAHGIAFDVYEPNAAEVEEALSIVLESKFRQNYTQRDSYTLFQHLRSVLRYGVKRAVFWTKALVERDPWNLHYSVTPYIAERRRLRDFPSGHDFHNDWRGRLELMVKERNGPIIYLPLAYFPEATSDYWVSNLRILNYDACVIEMVKALAGWRDGAVVVKEHLHMMGARNPSLYAEILRIPNVVSVHPTEYSNHVLEACDAVVMGSGSVGIEATVRGKPVFSFCDSSYWFRPSGAFRLDLDRIDSWGDVIRSALPSHRPNTPGENADFIRQCLRSCVRLRARGRIWPLIDAEILRTVLLAASTGNSSCLTNPAFPATPAHTRPKDRSLIYT